MGENIIRIEGNNFKLIMIGPNENGDIKGDMRTLIFYELLKNRNLTIWGSHSMHEFFEPLPPFQRDVPLPSLSWDRPEFEQFQGREVRQTPIVIFDDLGIPPLPLYPEKSKRQIKREKKWNYKR